MLSPLATPAEGPPQRLNTLTTYYHPRQDTQAKSKSSPLKIECQFTLFHIPVYLE